MKMNFSKNMKRILNFVQDAWKNWNAAQFKMSVHKKMKCIFIFTSWQFKLNKMPFQILENAISTWNASQNFEILFHRRQNTFQILYSTTSIFQWILLIFEMAQQKKWDALYFLKKFILFILKMTVLKNCNEFQILEKCISTWGGIFQKEHWHFKLIELPSQKNWNTFQLSVRCQLKVMNFKCFCNASHNFQEFLIFKKHFKNWALNSSIYSVGSRPDDLLDRILLTNG